MTSRQERRRWFGAFYLALAGLLLIWGQTLLRPYLRGWAFLVYWLACFIFTTLAMIVAWLDLRAVRQQLRQQQFTLIEKTLREAGSPVELSVRDAADSQAQPQPPPSPSGRPQADRPVSNE